MGGWQSSTKPDEQQLNYTLSSLSHQKECIEGLVKYIEEQQAQFNVFSQATESQAPGGESEALEDGDVDGNPEERVNPLERNKRTLVKANLSSLQWHVRVVQTSFSTLEKIIRDLAHHFATGQRRDELHAARSHIDTIHNLQLRVDGLEKQIEKHRNEISIQTKESEHLRYKNEELIEQKTNLESRNAELETNESSLRKELESLKQLLQDRENTRPVQLFYQSRGDTMSKVVNGLKTLLVNKLELERNRIQFIDCQSERDVNPEIPLFILCINTSRLGTDAVSALQKLKGCVSSNVSILIFHHKDVHALPSQSSERVLTGPDFKELGGIFDLAFLSEKGIYPCDMNDNTACGIVDILKPKD